MQHPAPEKEAAQALKARRGGNVEIDYAKFNLLFFEARPLSELILRFSVGVLLKLTFAPAPRVS
jgi:hypothetical protein